MAVLKLLPLSIFLSFSESDDSDVIPTHTFNFEFLMEISGVKMSLGFGIGEFSDQMYISLLDDGALIIGDTVYGVAPYILDIEYLQFVNESR